MPKSHTRKSKRSSRKNSISLTKIGTTTKDVAKASIPIIEKGVGAVYGTMSTGLDLGVKGVKKVTKSVSGKSRSASRSLALAGGRRTRRRYRNRH
jgi:hypothetical protein